MSFFSKRSNNLVEAAERIQELEARVADAEAQRARLKEYEAKMAAIGRSQAVIEFNLDGTIINANENFLNAVGYTASEIVGRHHSMFVDRAYAASNEYRQFWDRLNRGEYVAEKFRRISKSGREVWIQASYNPLFDDNGKAFKVIKFATDITAIEQERTRTELEKTTKAAELAKVVGNLADGLKQLAEGNLAHRMNDVFAQDYEQLRADFNGAIGKLQAKVEDALKGVNESADAVRAGTTDMSSAADDLSHRTEQQAAALEETAAALAGITETVHKTAEGAKLASSTVATARDEAKHSGEIVSKAVAAMQLIEESSRKVSQIIGVIDEIAFQTNLLALNAGVEAARAGDAGRGFAVVASEVRSLAQRAAEAAKEIKALISASSQHVDMGAKLVGETGHALERIVERVNEINGLVVTIANSAQEQAASLNQVNTAISEMDRSTQQNAAMVEESTAAIHALAQEADSMVAQMAKFELGQSSGAASPSRLPPPASARPIRRDTNSQVGALRSKLDAARNTGGRTARVASQRSSGRTNDGWEEF